MPSRNTYCLTWVSLTLDEGYLFTATPPDLEHGVAPLGRSCVIAAWRSQSLPLTLGEG